MADNTVLVIDNNLRTIKIPAGMTNIGVAGDKEVKRLGFRMPRFCGGFDLGRFDIFINYFNAVGDGDIANVDDITVRSDSISFTWLVDEFMTLHAGNVRFNVQMEKKSDGKVEKEFHTTYAVSRVLERVDPSGHIAATLPSIAEKWKDELFSRFDGQIDTTLKFSGMAADSRVTGQRIKKLEQAMSSPYNFKGNCEYASLPSSANVNDTYYCTDKKCKYSWNGSGWYQSSMDETDYIDVITALKNGDISALQDVINMFKFFVSPTGDITTIVMPDDFAQDGYRLDVASGKLTTNVVSRNESHTDFIPVEQGVWYLFVITGGGSGRGVCGYSDAYEATYVDYLFTFEDTTSTLYKLLQVPNNVKYIRAGTDNEARGKIYELGAITVSDIISLIDGIDDQFVIEDRSVVVEGETNENLTYGYYYNRKGEAVASTFDDHIIEDYIEIEPNTRYTWLGRFDDARAICQYDENKTLIKGILGSDVGNPSEFKFKSEPTARYFRASVYVFSTLGVYGLTKDAVTVRTKVEDLLLEIAELSTRVGLLDGRLAEEYEYKVPGVIYETYNDGVDGFYARNYIQSVYPESFSKSKLPLTVNDARCHNIACIETPDSVTKSRTITVKLSGDGYAEHSSDIAVQTTKSSACINKRVRYMAIGDSLTANDIPELDGVKRKGGNMQSCVMELQCMDAKDLGIDTDFIAVGTTNVVDRSFIYGDETVSFRSCAEGRGSRTTSNYLRHAYHTTTTVSGEGSGLENKAAWDFAGLGRKIPYDVAYDETASYEEYTHAREQRQLISDTPHGYYHWDYSVELFEFLSRVRPAMFVDISEYSESSVVKTAIDKAVIDILNNPSNPFFSWGKARETGNYAFSLETYLSRYKTIDNITGERLSVGTTAGSKITSTNVNSFDVCCPTHITVALGENDRWWYPEDSLKSSVDAKTLMDAIHEEYPDICVGFFTTRMMGVFYPDIWNDKIVAPSMNISSNNFKYEFNELMQEVLGDLTNQNETKQYFIPCYHVHSPLSFSTTRESINLATGDSAYVGKTGDINHSGRLANLSMGYQILSWIYYTLTR